MKRNEESKYRAIAEQAKALIPGIKEANAEVKGSEQGEIKYKYPQHAADQRLTAPDYGTDIFGQFSPSERSDMKYSGVTAEMVNRKGKGIKLTAKEEDLTDNIYFLIQEALRKKYKLKNGYQLAEHSKAFGEQTFGAWLTIPQILSVSLPEGTHIGGKSIKEAERALKELEDNPDKKCTIIYKRRENMEGKKKGEPLEMSIKMYEPILKTAEAEVRRGGGKEVKKLGGKLIKNYKFYILNPVYFDQKENYYILRYKGDTVRLKEAKAKITGKSKAQLTDIDFFLFKYILKHRSMKNFLFTESEKSLFPKLAPKEYAANRFKRIRGYFNITVQMLISVGELKSVTPTTNAIGEAAYIFELPDNSENSQKEK